MKISVIKTVFSSFKGVFVSISPDMFETLSFVLSSMYSLFKHKDSVWICYSDNWSLKQYSELTDLFIIYHYFPNNQWVWEFLFCLHGLQTTNKYICFSRIYSIACNKLQGKAVELPLVRVTECKA